MKNPRIYKNKIYTVEEVVQLVEILNTHLPLPNHVRKLTCRGKDGRLHSVEIAFNEFDERFSYRSEVHNDDLWLETFGGFFVYKNHKKVAKITGHRDNLRKRTEVVYIVELYFETGTRYRVFYKEGNEYAEFLVEKNFEFMSSVPCAHTGTGLFFVAMNFVEQELKNG